MFASKPSSVLIATFLLPIFSAQAGTIEQATIMAEPQMQVSDGAIQACGYRMMSASIQPGSTAASMLFDSSILLYRNGVVLLKGGATQAGSSGSSKGVNRPIVSFWLKAEGHKPTAPLEGKFIPSDTKGYLLMGIPIGSSVPLFGAMTTKAAVTIGMRLKGEDVDRIHTGVIQISDADIDAGGKCMSELIDSMKLGEVQPQPKTPN